ncbi:MAG: integrase, partial [Elusimicrobia bacterium]|nr:integrase [Elusimicrobiota bacterium]
CDYNRKYAIRILNALPSDEKNSPVKKRNKIYSDTVISILEAIWEASGYLWSQRLKAALPLWLPWAKKRFQITDEIEKQLLTISPAQIDRRLKNKKHRLKKKIYGTTRPGTLLKHHIQIKTDNCEKKGTGTFF